MRQVRFLICCVFLWGMSCLLHAQMLVVCAPEYMEEMKPFVTWKIQKGIPTQMVSMSEIGETYEDLGDYVKNYYQTHHNRYLLLVGDANQVPINYLPGYDVTPFTPYTDAEYGYVSGTYPPEVLVGRLSAETADDVKVQVEKIIFYEKNVDENTSWLSQCVGIADPSATDKGDNDETDIQHIRQVNSILEQYGYTAHETSTKKELTDLLNAGCGIVNYAGHGFMSGWATSDFSVSDVAALSNEGKFPVIISTGCDNGKFATGTCFAESFLRARNSAGDPIGAVGMLGFSAQVTWNPPMLGQDEMVRIMTSPDIPDSRKTFGEVANEAYRKVIEKYRGSGEDAAKEWILFGDPSMVLRTRTPGKMVVSHIEAADNGITSLSVSCDKDGAVVALSEGNNLLAVQTVEKGKAMLDFPAVTGDKILTVTVTAFDKVTYMGQVVIGDGSGLEVADSDASVTIYPNPSRGEIRIDGLSASSAFISIYSLDGSLIRKAEVDPNTSIPLNVEPGTYFLHLQSDGRYIVRRILVTE